MRGMSQYVLDGFFICLWAWMPLGAVVIVAFGFFSAFSPQRSIALYQWIMAYFNWRVSPIDEARELRTTRLLGGLLVVLGLVLGILVAKPR